MKILIVNGPNLNLLGLREPEIYGNVTMEDFLANLRGKFPDLQIDYFQSNHEGALIDRIQSADPRFSLLLGDTEDTYDGIVINPGAYAHYSFAIADAIAAINIPVIEVHISNIMEREEHRRKSVTATVCNKMIYGHGMKGYEMAVEELKALINQEQD